MAFEKDHAKVLVGRSKASQKGRIRHESLIELARNRRGEIGKGGTDSMVYARYCKKAIPSTETFIRIATLSAVNVSFDSPRPARSQDRLFPFLEDQQHST